MLISILLPVILTPVLTYAVWNFQERKRRRELKEDNLEVIQTGFVKETLAALLGQLAALAQRVEKLDTDLRDERKAHAECREKIISLEEGHRLLSMQLERVDSKQHEIIDAVPGVEHEDEAITRAA